MDDIRKSRKICAIVIKEILLSFKKDVIVNNKRVPISSLYSDTKLIVSLLKIGLFSVGASSFSDMEQESFGGRTKGTPFKNLPVALFCLSFIYALRIIPNNSTKEDIIKRSKFIEKVFGKINIDSILISEIESLNNEEGK